MDFIKVLDQTVREIKREVNKKVLKVPEIEQKVLDATSNEPWGPHGTLMAEIAQATKNFSEYQLVMDVLWRRIGDTGRNWRHVYKALTVLEYLVANGSERVVDELLERTSQISTLSDFQYVEPNGKDQGINVRKKAQNILSLINDKDKIREARQKAAANRDKYGGLSSTGGYKPSSYSGFGGGYDGDRYDDDHYRSGNGGRYGSDRDGQNRDGDRYGQDGGERYSRSTDKYEDDDFARIRDHEDDRYGSKKGYDDDDQYSSRYGQKQTEGKIGVPPSYESLTDSGSHRTEERVQGSAAKASNSGHNQAATKGTPVSALDSANDEFDDFDPRGSSKTVAATPVATFTDDIFSLPSAGKHSDVMKAIPPPPSSAGSVPISAGVSGTSSGTDLFTDASFNATFVDPPASATKSLNKSPLDTLFPPSEDLFAAQTSSTVSVTASTTFGISGGSSMFEAAPSKSSATQSGFGNADPFEGNVFGDFVTSETSEPPSMFQSQAQPFVPAATQAFEKTSQQPTAAEHSNTTVAAKSQQQKEKFEPKSAIWADSLSRGLIDLNISAPKSTSLAEIGIHLDSITSSERKEEEKKAPPFSRGKAMGSGSGLGRAGASTMAAPVSPMMGPYGMGAYGANMGMGAYGTGTGAGVGGGMGAMMGLGTGITPGTVAPGVGMGPAVSMPSNTGAGFATNFTMGAGQGGLSSQQKYFGGFR
uniref:ENTH domain-containing protein n=1 Tax=Araucaria cunninghamii TaxID=56994 RepID=A0A0D6QWN1_ARACU